MSFFRHVLFCYLSNRPSFLKNSWKNANSDQKLLLSLPRKFYVLNSILVRASQLGNLILAQTPKNVHKGDRHNKLRLSEATQLGLEVKYVYRYGNKFYFWIRFFLQRSCKNYVDRIVNSLFCLRILCMAAWGPSRNQVASLGGGG